MKFVLNSKDLRLLLEGVRWGMHESEDDQEYLAHVRVAHRLESLIEKAKGKKE